MPTLNSITRVPGQGLAVRPHGSGEISRAEVRGRREISLTPSSLRHCLSARDIFLELHAVTFRSGSPCRIAGFESAADPQERRVNPPEP